MLRFLQESFYTPYRYKQEECRSCFLFTEKGLSGPNDGRGFGEGGMEEWNQRGRRAVNRLTVAVKIIGGEKRFSQTELGRRSICVCSGEGGWGSAVVGGRGGKRSGVVRPASFQLFDEGGSIHFQKLGGAVFNAVCFC